MKIKDYTTYKTIDWMGFGNGTIPVAVDSKDGEVVRIRPIHYEERYAPEDINHWTLDVRGHKFDIGMKSYPSAMSIAYKKRARSANRIPYPMKRVDWDPKGERNPQNRGKSKFVQISWDEAAQLIADEIMRVKETYGLPSILIQGDGHGEAKTIGGCHGCMTRLFDVYCGHDTYTIQARQPDSWEGWYWGAKFAWAQEPVGRSSEQTNLFKDICENSQMVLMWGCDPETTCQGWGGMVASRMENFWQELGIELIAIAPDYNYAAAAHADKWIPVLPNTDAALQLAIAHTWIVEGLYEKDYVETHTVGFDWLESYVLGKIDGIEKTPKWAEEKCGVPARRIKALARHWAKLNTSIAHGEGGSYIRAAYAHEPARLEVCLLAMQGLGHPGRNQIHMLDWNIYYIEKTSPVPTSGRFFATYASYTGHLIDPASMTKFIPQTFVPEAILGDYTDENPLTWYGRAYCGLPLADQFVQWQYPAPGASRIHFFWTDTPCWETCWNGGNRMQDALRSEEIEIVIAQHPWFENEVNFADIILPVSTKLEQDDIQVSICGPLDLLVNEAPACTPFGESLTDFEVVMKVAEKLGCADQLLESLWGDCSNDEKINGVPYEKAKKIAYEGSGLLGEVENWCDTTSTGSLEMGKLAVAHPAQFTAPPFEEFEEQGYLVLPVKENWELEPAGFYPFFIDPVANPLGTPSGKIEIYSSQIAEHWPDDEERRPYPQWIEEGESHSERLTIERGKDYPFLIVSNHGHYRFHAEHDDSPWLRENGKVIGPDGYGYEPIWINPVDAEAKGIKSGDVVKIFNERGTVLGGAIVTERIVSHALLMDHGARVDVIVPGYGVGLDRGGANNLIAPHKTTSKNALGEVTSGFLVDVEKVDVFELAKQYPEEFGRAYSPIFGLIPESRIIEEA